MFGLSGNPQKHHIAGASLAAGLYSLLFIWAGSRAVVEHVADRSFTPGAFIEFLFLAYPFAIGGLSLLIIVVTKLPKFENRNLSLFAQGALTAVIAFIVIFRLLRLT